MAASRVFRSSFLRGRGGGRGCDCGRGLASAAFPPGACSVAHCPAALPPALEAGGGPWASVLLLPVFPSTFICVLCSLPGPRVGSSAPGGWPGSWGCRPPRPPPALPGWWWGKPCPFSLERSWLFSFYPAVYLGTVWKFQI